MTGSNKVVRLSKAAREFNISLDSIVSFLTDKGYDIERKPNTKLDPEMYELLTNEFQDEKHVKEVAQQKGLEYVGKESISIHDAPEKEPKVSAEIPVEEELMIKNTGVSYDSNNNTEEKPVEKIIVEETVPEPEIEAPIVEIEKPKPVVVEETVVAEEEVIEEPVVIKKPIITEEPIVTKEPILVPEPIEIEEPVDIKEEEEPVIEIVDEQPEVKTIEVPEIVEQNEETITTTDEVIEVPDVVSETEIIEGLTEKKEIEEPSSTEQDQVEAEEGSHDIKVLGKIDLDTLNQKTRPKKKTKAEKRKEQEGKNKTTKSSKPLEQKPKVDKAPTKKEEAKPPVEKNIQKPVIEATTDKATEKTTKPEVEKKEDNWDT